MAVLPLISSNASCGEHGGGYLVSHEGTKPRRGEKITVAGLATDGWMQMTLGGER